MPPILYSDRQIALVREAGKVIGKCLTLIKSELKAGVTTKHLDALVADLIKKEGAQPAFLNYQQGDHTPFPACICASVNDVVIHGVPDEQPLKEGDLLSIDIGVRKDLYYADSAWTFAVGSPDEVGAKMLKCGEDVLNLALTVAKPKSSLIELGKTIQKFVEESGFHVVREFVGHGVGLSLHEEPQVRNYYDPADTRFKDVILKPGMILAIEPMITEKSAMIKFGADEWTVRTGDGGRSVHFEHTIAITSNGPEILTAH